MSEEDILAGLEKISQTVGKYPDMVQGGGGNTSAKLNDEIMAIKASGYKLTQITKNEGYVKVNYQNLLDYFKNVDTTREIDFEKESSQKALENVVSEEKLKPSVETGFHSFLKRYVIHTHSCYANILCCSEEGKDLVGEIFAETDYNPLWIKYTHPGFDLTIEMKERIKDYRKKWGREPEVLFLENHGLIITHEDADTGLQINKEINAMIKDYLEIYDSYPEVGIEKISAEAYRSNTEYLQDYFRKHEVKEEFFNQVLYPDQLVYLENSVSINDDESRINIDTNSGEIIYNAKYNEAKTIDETMTAFIYIREYIENNDLTLKTMPQKYVDLIKNMQAENHRKKVMKDMEEE